jgi:hypothetical protein
MLLEGLANSTVPNAHKILTHHSVFDPDSELGEALDDLQLRIRRGVGIILQLMANIEQTAVNLLLYLRQSATG